MSNLEVAQGGYAQIEAGIEEIKKAAWDGMFESVSLYEVNQCLRRVVSKAENLRLTVQSVLLMVPDRDEGRRRRGVIRSRKEFLNYHRRSK